MGSPSTSSQSEGPSSLPSSGRPSAVWSIQTVLLYTWLSYTMQPNNPINSGYITNINAFLRYSMHKWTYFTALIIEQDVAFYLGHISKIDELSQCNLIEFSAANLPAAAKHRALWTTGGPTAFRHDQICHMSAYLERHLSQKIYSL